MSRKMAIFFLDKLIGVASHLEKKYDKDEQIREKNIIIKHPYNDRHF